MCRMLDDAGVPNGDKAIAGYLRVRWTPDLKAEHGSHDKPHESGELNRDVQLTVILDTWFGLPGSVWRC